MSKRDILLLLDDMFQSALKIKRYTKDIDYGSFVAYEPHSPSILYISHSGL